MSDCECGNEEKNFEYADIQQTERNHVESITQTIVFEPTMVGRKSRKTIKFHTVTKSVNYILKRDPNSNPIYHVFEVKIPNDVIETGECLSCIVTYSPQIPDQKNVDYFQLIDSNFEVLKICVQGESIGPSVRISIKNIYFYKTKTIKSLINAFEITNFYNGEVHFHFDANEDDKDQELFKVDKVRGILAPHKYSYVTVRFAGTKNGFYSNHLFCRVENHPPLMIRLFAIVSPTIEFDPEHVNLINISDKYPTAGFEGYMYDSIKRTSIKPPLSLSTNYLDFDSVEYQENFTQSKTLVTSLTNHLNEEITVIWMNDNDQVFSISPKIVTLPPQESVLYECCFKPDHSDRLYTKLITGQVFWSNFWQKFKEAESLEEIYVPMNLSVVLSGRSFPPNQMWLPLVKINPNVIVLPPTVPRSPSYTTAVLQSSSSLPTSFKFVSPNKTNFLLKPMQGVIYGFQVIVVQLQPDETNNKAYVERWSVEFNGRPEDCVPIYLKGFAENISVSIGNDNVVAFRTMQPGCQDIVNVLMANKTIHYIKYNFFNYGQEYLTIEHPEGDLASNEFVNLRWCLTGGLTVPERFFVKCVLHNVNKLKMLTGDSLDHRVTVYNKCIYSELCATPSFYDFGQIEYGSSVAISFYLFNFGESPVHFQLCKKESEETTNSVNIVPSVGSLESKNKMEIIINIDGTVIGTQNIEIIYKLRLNETSSILVEQNEERVIFLVSLKCSYATVQVCDIADTNFGFLFSKISLWNMFNLTKLNHMLATIKHGENKTFQMYVPEYEKGKVNFYVKLILQNVSNFSTNIKFQWKKNCGCKKIQKSIGMSFRQYSYKCAHRNMFKMSMDHDNVEPSLINVLQLNVNYLEYGLTKVWYTISLAYNRTINLYIDITVLPEIITMPSKYLNTYDFKLETIYIGEKEPPSQVFPIYNNSGSTVSYSINMIPLFNINFHYDFEIFSCVNPSGKLLPFTSLNILLKFHPITTETYTVLVPIKMGDQQFILNIIGKGCDKLTDYYGCMMRTLPSIVQHPYLDVTVNLSTDYLVVKPFQVWTGRENMVFIKNQSNDKLIGYSWQNVSIEGVVLVEAVRKKGLLHPKEFHAIPIRLQAFNQPCLLNLTMTCKLLDHTKHIKHKESEAEYYHREQELAGQFTITEKGTLLPKNEVKILPKPEAFFITLSISVCIISSSDRDLYLSVEDQLQKSPQKRLKLDIGVTFIDYCSALVESLEKGPHFRNIIDLPKLNFENKSKCLEMFKTVIECIFANIMLSNVFGEYLRFSNNLYQPYYSQCVVQSEIFEPMLRIEILKKKHFLELKKHMQLVKSFLNSPQATTIDSVLKELIRDSIHSVFQLGGRLKPEKAPFEYAYGIVKHKFRCPICKCKH